MSSSKPVILFLSQDDERKQKFRSLVGADGAVDFQTPDCRPFEQRDYRRSYATGFDDVPAVGIWIDKQDSFAEKRRLEAMQLAHNIVVSNEDRPVFVVSPSENTDEVSDEMQALDTGVTRRYGQAAFSPQAREVVSDLVVEGSVFRPNPAEDMSVDVITRFIDTLVKSGHS
ncbi:MAG: hypothetical protein OXU45_05870 [Candidatus Melainabacteria bacterium]|nr:hypothetical protein [Candidatus Melainabacteria bacterium]